MGKGNVLHLRLALAALLLCTLCVPAFAQPADDTNWFLELIDANHAPELNPPLCLQGQPDNPFENPNGWMGPTILSFAIMLGVIAAVFALSGLQGGVSQGLGPGGGFYVTQLTTTKLRTWCKESLFILISTMIIISMVMASYEVLKSIGLNYLDNAISYAHIIGNTMKLDFSFLVVFSLLISFLSQTPSFAVWGFGIKFSLVPVLKPIFDMLGIIMNLSIASIGEWYAHEYFLCFVKSNMLAVFFPLAIFARAFGSIKAFGDAMLGLAIGFFFIYPFMMDMSGQVIAQRYGQPVIADNAQELCGLGGGGVQCVYWMPTRQTLGMMWEGTKEQFGSALSLDSTLGLLLAIFTGIWGFVIIDFSFMFLLSMLQTVAYFVFIVSVLLPVFNIFVTITISMEIAKVLGTEIDLSSIEKLI